MKFIPTPLQGAYIIELEPKQDERGSFARAWCRQELEAHGLVGAVAQCNLSCTEKSGTVRGLHYQLPPHEEVKCVRCIAGAVFDVAVDLRKDSPSFRRWFGLELTAENGKMLYVPRGCAHGYQTLLDKTEVFYLVSHPYSPEAERGVRWNDPAFGITWPLPVSRISKRDESFPDFRG